MPAVFLVGREDLTLYYIALPAQAASCFLLIYDHPKMLSAQLMYIACIVLVVVLLALNLALHDPISHKSDSSLDYTNLLQIIKAQNATIYALERSLDVPITERDIEVGDLSRSAKTIKTKLVQHEGQHDGQYLPALTDNEIDCEARYGMHLVSSWRNSKEVWCSDESLYAPSLLNCYPYHQQHKKRDGRGPDLFCEESIER